MRLSSLLAFSLFFLLNIFRIFASTCWDLVDPRRPKEFIKADCPTESGNPPNLKRDNDDMFVVTFTCTVNDQTLCNKVKTAFTTAGKLITASIAFKTPVTVNATFTSFCVLYNECSTPTTTLITLGGAAPARTMEILDSDGVTRLFPQSLVKQMNLDNHPAYSSFDILALFNSDTNYWFDGDGPIHADQSDFLFLIVHELMHGLGFTTGYEDYLNNPAVALTPYIAVTQSSNSSGIIFTGFVEMIFDKFMVILSTGQRISNITKQLNTFAGGPGALFANSSQFISQFEASSQYNLAKQVMTYATTPKAIGLLPVNSSDISQAIILETSLVPYVGGSSVSHVDYQTYSNTSDFLMRYLQDRGKTLGQSIILSGNYSGGPIGPKLRSFLSWSGYTVLNQSVPFSIIGDSSYYLNISSDANNIIPSLGYTCTLATLFFFWFMASQ
ncbi:4652_t:CDS:2 [Acaulospora morrowiae]|uniref:4652_t:CDS:1 n=1 Tax=Acaulospora morrowiae TaxID=94023 RepID=A0A9N9C8J4_9GLOM|nr:4652_t:CDS:2 [Acaulospora morrowiae]